MHLIDIIATIVCDCTCTVAHKSGVWLYEMGLTARMHSYTSEASVTAKI